MVEPLPPVIDGTICTSCGACIAVCPDRVLQPAARGGVAVVAARCLLCGHCQAICPVAAISIPALQQKLGLLSVGEADPVAGVAAVSTDALVQLMRARRSCRQFRAEPVDLARLTDLVRIGTTAPSGTNSQGWRFLILPERADVQLLGEATARFYRELNRKAARPLYRWFARLVAGEALNRYFRRHFDTVEQALAEWHDKGVDRLFHGAPAAIVVAADTASSCPAEDALLASGNILLAAETMNLGTCLIGFVVEAARRDKRIGALLGLADGERIYSVIACGHPAVTFRRPAGRKAVLPRILRLSR